MTGECGGGGGWSCDHCIAGSHRRCVGLVTAPVSRHGVNVIQTIQLESITLFIYRMPHPLSYRNISMKSKLAALCKMFNTLLINIGCI